MATTPTADQLALEFVKIINQWLTPAQIAEVNRRNATAEYANACASHDYCDANQAMIDALEVFGIEFSLELADDVINAAWDIAKSCQFDASKISAK